MARCVRSSYFDRREPHGHYKSFAGSFPGMDDIGTENHIIPFFGQGNGFLRLPGVKGDVKGAANQNRDGRAVAVRPGTWPLVPVRMKSPFDLDVGLVPEAQFGRHELADKPASTTNPIRCRVAEIKLFRI